MTDERPPLEQLLDRVLFAPLGVLVAWRDELPKLAAQGRREVQTARMFGQFAAQQAQRELERRLGRDRTAAPRREPSEPAAAPSSPPADAPVATPATVVDLPIADYDSLAASQVVARLGALSADELDAVERYESAGRGRRTILGKIQQLRASA